LQGVFAFAVASHAGKSQRQAAGIAGTFLQVAEGNLGNHFRIDINRVKEIFSFFLEVCPTFYEKSTRVLSCIAISGATVLYLNPLERERLRQMVSATAATGLF